MTEAEWLASDDPAVTLRWVDGSSVDQGSPWGGPGNRAVRIGDRKLRLWVEACRAGQKDREWGDYDIDTRTGLEAALDRWCKWTPSVMPVDPLPARAALLRDVVGNPFRPVTLEWHVDPLSDERRLYRLVSRVMMNRPNPHPREEWIEVDWLTPTVLSLARAADEERERKCPECGGNGLVKHEDDHGFFHTGCKKCGGDGRMTWRDGGRRGPPVVEPGRKGTGRIDDGTLDPARLAVLADALEEAGCDSEELLRHLRGEERCGNCLERPGYSRLYPRDQLSGSGPVYGTCWECYPRDDWNAFKLGYRRGDPAAIGSGWRKLSGPHVRGCWAVDLVLGKE